MPEPDTSELIATADPLRSRAALAVVFVLALLLVLVLGASLAADSVAACRASLNCEGPTD